MAVFQFIYSLLRGNIPGGPIILLILLGMFSFVLWFVVKTSGILEAHRGRSILFRGWIILIAGYIVLWLVTKPPPLPKTLLVAPFNDQTTERWIGEALTDQLGQHLSQQSRKLLWLPNDAIPQLHSQSNPDSTWEIIRKLKPSYAVWGKIWGRHDSLWVELHYARTRLGATVRYSSDKRRYISLHDAIKGMINLAQNSAHIPRKLNAEYRPEAHNLPALAKLYQSQGYYSNGYYDSALEFASLAVNVDSTLDDAWRIAGNCLSETDDTLSRAISAYRKAVFLDSSDVRNWQALARHSIRHQNWNRAETALKVAYKLGARNPVTLFLLSHFSEQRLQNICPYTTQETLEKAIRICPGYTQARLKLAKLYYENRDLHKCNGILDEGLTIDPHAWELWELKATTHLNLGDLNRAKLTIEKAANITSIEPTIYYNLGLIQYRLGHSDEAATALERSIKLAENPDAYYLLGLCAEQQNDTSAAIQYYQSCIVSVSDNDNPCAQEAKNNCARLRGID